MSYTIRHIADVLNTKAIIANNVTIEHLLIDSRKIVFPSSSLFFALHGPRRNGHQFIKEVYERGIRDFVVQKQFDASQYANANFILVDDVLHALQQLAAYHRNQFNIPVIGITGSNGKTIVKEWLNQLLQPDYTIARSPRSYNSQIGVPLSVWQLNTQHTLGIFEAGISTIGEMDKLEKIIHPTIGILTNIGDAHNEGFFHHEQKITEKLKLFANCEVVISRAKDYQLYKTIISSSNNKTRYLTWGNADDNDFVIRTNKKEKQTQLHIKYKSVEYAICIPFEDEISVENAITCCCVLLFLGYEAVVINERVAQLQAIEMRMQLKKAINNCYVLNDSYSNDLASLSITLDYLKQQAGNNATTVILSDILQSGLHKDELYKQVGVELQQRNIKKLIGIGAEITRYRSLFENIIPHTTFFTTTDDFLQHITSQHFRDEYILLKGARVFAFERISKWLEQKVHQTVMEINLSAMIHNLKEYQKHLKPSTKMMAMVKAFSYGSGSAEVARVLQFHKVDYLAVAYADEGVELCKAGISLPIMVMNADAITFDTLVEYNLEPEIYSFNMYHAFHQYLSQQGITQFPVHIKVNTGMNRLGFEYSEANGLCSLLVQHNTMAVRSVFSHLVGSEDASFDDFTNHQAILLNGFCNEAEKILGYSFIKHIANSAAIFRHPELQFDMVRLGIGLYGVDSADGKEVSLETVTTLKATIAQIRHLNANDTVSYNRKGKLQRNSTIATIRIGYADGFSRRLGNSIGGVYIKGKLAPVIGNVCMDMIMADITGIDDVREDDEVEIFGKYLPVQQVAKWCNTISYEILTGISQRVKRVYIEE